MAKILIVEVDQDTRQLLKVRLESQGYGTAFAADGVTAIAVARTEPIDNEVLLGAMRSALGEG